MTERRPAPCAVEARGAAARAFLPRVLALIGALALHGAALGALVVAVQTTPGSSGSVLEAIEVELVDGAALASREPAPANIITGALADIAPTDGAPAVADGAAAPTPAPTPEPPAPVTTAQIDPLPEAPIDEATREARKDTEPPPPEVVSVDLPSAGAAAVAGGAAARALEASPAAAPAAMVRATAGDVRAYARSVSAALARSRPRGAAGVGVSRVVFTIDRDGGLAEVNVSRSSGNARLDTLAIEAVRRAKFAAPPAKLSLADRTFEVPYTFR